MAIVRNPSNTVRRGRIGETTYYVSGGQQVARQARNSSNYGVEARRSQSQQNRRVLWANLVNFYKISAGWMPKAFETRKANQTDYNKFMQLNIVKARIPLTKSEAAASAAVADSFIVSQGSLPSIEVLREVTLWRTNIATGDVALDGGTEVSTWSKALIDNNANIREGMQLSFVSYQQSIDALGTPRLICRCYEVIIDTKNGQLMDKYIPDFAMTTRDGYLATDENISLGGFAYILSELRGGKLYVSTQQLVVNNADMLARYTSSKQRAMAIDSYGLDREVILSPVTANEQQAEGQPVYITKFVYNNKNYYPNDEFGDMSVLTESTVKVYLSTQGEDLPNSVSLISTTGNRIKLTNVEVEDDFISGKVPMLKAGSGTLEHIEVELANRTLLNMSFGVSGSGYGGDL